jgi:adenine-specific DNA glycosylase
VVSKGDRVLLLRRSDPTLLDETWELPGVDVSHRNARAALTEHLASLFKDSPTVGAEIGRVKHSITNRRITLCAYAVRLTSTPRASAGKRTWANAGSLEELFVSSMTTKIIRAIAPYLRSRR